MLFTVELHNLKMLKYRFQKDNSWLNLGNKIKLSNNDFTSENPSIITSMSSRKKTIKLEDVTYDVDPGEWPTEREQVYYKSLLFRETFPNLPSKEQLIDTISLGNDKINNTLVLNINGVFELRQSPPWDYFENDPSYVVRHETFIGGNDYVGVNASKDLSLINDLYITSIEFWSLHLTNHMTQNFSDISSQKSESDIITELNHLKNSWLPDF